MGTWSNQSLRDVLEDLVASEHDNPSQKPSVSSLGSSWGFSRRIECQVN